MEKLFKKCRYTLVLSVLAGIVLGAAAFYYVYCVRGDTLTRAVLPAPIVLVVTICIGRYVSRLVSVREYQMIMSLLYADLQPDKFIAAVEPLASASTDTVTKVTTLAHLANGYAAVGRFEDAHKILEGTELPPEAVALRGLLLNNLISCLLLEGKTQDAKRCQVSLRNLLRDERCSKEFREKSRNVLAYQDICFNIHKGRAADIAALERDFEGSRNELHRLEVKLYLAIAYKSAGDQEKFQQAQAYVMEKSGDRLYYGKLARELA